MFFYIKNIDLKHSAPSAACCHLASAHLTQRSTLGSVFFRDAHGRVVPARGRSVDKDLLAFDGPRLPLVVVNAHQQAGVSKVQILKVPSLDLDTQSVEQLTINQKMHDKTGRSGASMDSSMPISAGVVTDSPVSATSIRSLIVSSTSVSRSQPLSTKTPVRAKSV